MSTHNIYLYTEVDKKYSGSILKTTKLICALIGVCAVIRANTVVENSEDPDQNAATHLNSVASDLVLHRLQKHHLKSLQTKMGSNKRNKSKWHIVIDFFYSERRIHNDYSIFIRIVLT